MKELRNEHLELSLSEVGAELFSIRSAKSGNEYLWQGDAAYWDRRSPTLFPLVGGLWGGTYLLNGKAHTMEKHGFARCATFEVTAEDANSVRMTFHDTAETRQQFPFQFQLDSTFRLDKNRIHVEWEVHNPNAEPLPFHIGGHPGFFYPDFDSDTPLCGYLSFDNNTPESAAVGRGGCLGDVRYALPLEDGLLPVTDECFNNDAIIIDRNQIRRVTLHDKQKRPIVTVESEAPVTLIWSPYGIKAPFLCVEPWYGLCDHEDYNGEFANRPYTNIAPAGNSWKGGYTITLEQE